MNFFTKFAKTTTGIHIFILIVFAFLFSVGMRFTWIYWATNMIDGNAFKWNGEFMVTTNDSYYWAEGARDLIFCDKSNANMGEYYQQNCHQENDLSPVDEPLPKITYFFYNILPFSLETIIFYMSAFAGSLLVIPFILIGGRFNLPLAGFIAALIASIGTSYYSRTVLGYYDTDIFNIFFPMMIVWSLALSLKTKIDLYVLLTGIAMALYKWCYPQGYSLEFAFCGIVVLYIIYIFLTKRDQSENLFNYQLLSIMLISIIGAPLVVRLIIMTVLYLLIFKREIGKPLYILAGSLIIFLLTDGFGPIIDRLNAFIFQRDGTIDYEGLYFFSVSQTIVELQGISIKEIPLRTIGSVSAFIVGIIGYAWLCLRQPVMLVMLPLLGLGLLSLWGGLRFIMYIIPITAFGMGFFIFRITELMRVYIKDRKVSLVISTAFVCAAFIWSLYALAVNVWDYKASAVFERDEVKIIEDFGKNASREDYVVTWWDYGYPIRYYADVKTLIDGGKHGGDVNFPVSFALSYDQKSAAQMARLDVEYTEKRAQIVKDGKSDSIPNNNIAWMMKEYGFADSNSFIRYLKNDIKLPEKTRDIYFYLPHRMLHIYPTIMRFSHLDLASGTDRSPLFFTSGNFEDTGNALILDKAQGMNGYYIDKTQGMLVTQISNRRTIPLKRFAVIGYDDKGALQKNIQNMHYNGVYSLVYLRSYGVFLVMDENMYNSVYFKLFYLEEYDKDIFEFISGNPYAKIFKLKI
jgi:dolichyl-diphosphooligosaccharide--protein glycosyltransferase/undecaprenyl-diphosphooligosaccharide--protein glycosyltransferase